MWTLDLTLFFLWKPLAFVFTPLLFIYCRDFVLFSIILYYFLHTYTSKPVHMLFFFLSFFFKLPHSFDVLARFINFIWEYKSRSPGERSFMNCFSPTWFYWFHSVLFPLKPQIFSHVCCGSSVFKSLSNRTCRVRGGWGGSALPGRGFAVLTQSSDRFLSEEFLKSWYSFSDICAAEPHVHLPTAEHLLCSPAGLHWDTADRLQICQDAKMLAFWLRLPDFFVQRKTKGCFTRLKKNGKGKI